MQLDTGLGGGFALSSWPGVSGTNAEASPRGPATATEAGFGVSAGGDVDAKAQARTTGFLTAGSLALAALVFVWWSLPS
jgi:hypothetical protein